MQDRPERDEPEVLEGLPVLGDDPAGAAEAPRAASPAVVPTRQVAALAAGGFVAGAATMALAHRRRSRALARKKKGRTALGEVVSSGSFLVDVHVLRRD